MKKRVLIIGFSLLKQYKSPLYKNILSKFDNAFFTIPSKYFWKRTSLPLTIFYTKILLAFRSLGEEGNWISYNNLKTYNHYDDVNILLPKLSMSLKKISDSFKLSRHFINQLKNDSFEFKINKVECSAYLLDSLQRFVPIFKIYNPNSLSSFFSLWLYIYNILRYLNWLDSFVKKTDIDTVIVNHNVYMESGFISFYLKERYGCNIIFFSEKTKKPVKIESRQKWFKKTLELKLSESLSKNKKHSNLKKDIWKLDDALFNLDDCSNKIFNKNKVVIIMHCFSDANSMHFENGVIFSSYFQWIRKTISIAKKNKSIEYIFRAHPNSYEVYKNDIKILNLLFKNLNETNIRFEKPGNYTNYFENNSMPLFITAKGNFSQELAIAGIKCITLDESSAPNNCCIIIKNLNEYINWLSGNGDYNELRLTKEKRYNAITNKESYSALNKLI